MPATPAHTRTAPRPPPAPWSAAPPGAAALRAMTRPGTCPWPPRRTACSAEPPGAQTRAAVARQRRRASVVGRQRVRRGRAAWCMDVGRQGPARSTAAKAGRAAWPVTARAPHLGRLNVLHERGDGLAQALNVLALLVHVLQLLRLLAQHLRGRVCARVWQYVQLKLRMHTAQVRAGAAHEPRRTRSISANLVPTAVIILRGTRAHSARSSATSFSFFLSRLSRTCGARACVYVAPGVEQRRAQQHAGPRLPTATAAQRPAAAPFACSRTRGCRWPRRWAARRTAPSAPCCSS